MKIAVIAANGKAGSLIVDEALSRGHEVTAIVRGENRTKAQHAIIKPIQDITAADLEGFDAVVDAFGAFAEQDLPLHTATAQQLADISAQTGVHFYIVGGAGSLFVDPEHTTQLVDTDEFPAEYRPLANAQRVQLGDLRARTDAAWTFVSPAVVFDAAGERTGSYTLSGEELSFNDKGESVVSYADFAIAMVDLVEDGGHVRERVSVRW